MPTPTISRTALLVGLCALIPFPFLDELARRYLLAMSFEEQARLDGRPLPAGVGWKLAKRRANILVGCLLAVFWWPVKKLFRTFFYFLTVKDALDWMADAAVRGAMVRRALDRGHLPADVDRVWTVLDRCADDHMGSPVTRMLLRKDSPPPAWGGEVQGVDGLLASLARYGGAHATLEAYDAALGGEGADRVAPARLAAGEE